MFMSLILLAVLFLFGFISTAHYVDVQRVRTWLYTPSSKSTNKVNTILEQPRTLVESSQVGRVATKSECNELTKGPDGTELKRVFETFDKNGDGYITREELKEGMKGAGVEMEESEIEEMVEKMDVDGDGLIDLSEFCKSYEVGNGEECEEVLREAFEVFDENKDGVISVEELGLVLKSLGLKQGLKVKDCEEMIKKVDMDGDGMIDFGEFKKMMKSGGSLFGSSSSS